MLNRKIEWPEGKKSAGMVSIELDGEFIWLLIDPTNINRPKTLSMGTYGLLRGLDRMLLSLKERDIKATFFVPGIMAERYPDDIRKVAAAGHEIALHGYALENFGLLSVEEQQIAIEKGIAAIEKATGTKPVGFRLPEGNMTPETLKIINDAGFLYDSSMPDDDIPYQCGFNDKAGDGSSSGNSDAGTGMIEIPMRWELQDFPYFAFNFFPPFPLGECRISNYDEVMDIWLTEMRGYEKKGLCYVIKFDPQTIGTPARIDMFDRVLDEMLAKDMWIASGQSIAEYYQKRYSY